MVDAARLTQMIDAWCDLEYDDDAFLESLIDALGARASAPSTTWDGIPHGRAIEVIENAWDREMLSDAEVAALLLRVGPFLQEEVARAHARSLLALVQPISPELHDELLNDICSGDLFLSADIFAVVSRDAQLNIGRFRSLVEDALAKLPAGELRADLERLHRMYRRRGLPQ